MIDGNKFIPPEDYQMIKSEDQKQLSLINSNWPWNCELGFPPLIMIAKAVSVTEFIYYLW